MIGLSGSKVCHEWLWQLLLRCHLMLWRWWLIEESHDRVLRHLRRCWRRLRFGVLAAKTPVRVQVKQVALTFAENEVVMLVLRTSWLYYESAFSFCEKYKYLLEITYWTNTNILIRQHKIFFCRFVLVKLRACAMTMGSWTKNIIFLESIFQSDSREPSSRAIV